MLQIRTGGSLSEFIEFVEFIGFIELTQATQATQQTQVTQVTHEDNAFWRRQGLARSSKTCKDGLRGNK